MNTRIFVIYILLLIFVIKITAQTNDSTYQQYLLNPKIVPKRVYYTDDSRNIIKTNPLTIFDGYLHVIWEHKFKNNLGFDVAPGIILPYTIFDLIGKEKVSEIYKASFPFIRNSEFLNNKFGIGIQLEPKLYIGANPWGAIGTFYSFKSYSALLIQELGITFNVFDYYKELHKVSSQMGITISYVIQTPKSDQYNVRYIGKQSDNLNIYGLYDINSIRISLRVQVGKILRNKIIKNNQNL